MELHRVIVCVTMNIDMASITTGSLWPILDPSGQQVFFVQKRQMNRGSRGTSGEDASHCILGLWWPKLSNRQLGIPNNYKAARLT